MFAFVACLAKTRVFICVYCTLATFAAAYYWKCFHGIVFVANNKNLVTA